MTPLTRLPARLLARLLPDRLAGRIFLTTGATLVGVVVVMGAIGFYAERQQRAADKAAAMAPALLQIYAAAFSQPSPGDVSALQEIARRAGLAEDELTVGLRASGEVPPPGWNAEALSELSYGPDTVIWAWHGVFAHEALAEAPFSLMLPELARLLAHQHDRMMLSVHLPAGGWLDFTSPDYWRTRATPVQLGLMAIGALVIAALMFGALAQKLAEPFTRIAREAGEPGFDLSAPPLEPGGPHEARAAAEAINRTQAELREMIGERTRMLAAISHDLRTPATRLRLRAEYIESETLKDKILGDLDELSGMISAVLEFLREGSTDEEFQIVAFASLLQSLCDDYIDTGMPVIYHEPPPLRFTTVHSVFGGGGEAVDFEQVRSLRLSCRPKSLRRAFANLIENAVKYGGRAHVRVDASADQVLVEVSDNGPGIPARERENVFKPFYRLEASRNRATGGSGLGLSIVKSVIAAHGGTIELLDNPDGGLLVRTTLPRHL
ncbi:sensor histidine kinase [Radicibacter daui]|uniref:sensor histidine kinase n=1 Tax=Radicibacter daui TaxID=3064829 RepID=UPI0040468BF8